MSNGICLLAMTLWLSQVAPPSKERVKAMVFALKSFQATYTSPFVPTNGCAPIPNPGPLLLSIRVAVKVAPWSLDRARRMPPPLDPPSAASQAIYTLSRNGDPGFVSVVIMGLSLKWFSPPENEKYVTVGYVLPPSVDLATAIS